jgi:FkbM family methyltransferase
MIIVQIGAFQGDDDLTRIIKNLETTEISKIILVEPQKEFNDKLKECYKDYNFVIENVVITPNENETKVKFYHCEEEKNKEISSISKEHLFKHNQMNFIESELDCVTINNLLINHGISILDILFIDAEGMDEKIIKSIDFSKFYIKKIYYENLHINNEELIGFLQSKNYHINKYQLSNGWTNEAIRKN